MRNTATFLLAITVLAFLFPCSAPAHFGMIIPSTDNVGTADKKEIGIELLFTHPFQGGPLMDLAKPVKFGVVMDGKTTDLRGTLKERKIDGKRTWETSYKIKRPGDYAFFMLPQPYWEPAEDKFIVHATKVIVDALGAEEGWDAPIAKSAGLPCEIIPLSRPYGLYAGNVFTGRVMMGGKPVPNAEVEVEWWGKGKTKAPTDAHVTQVVKAGPNGIFSFALPKAGWWGFAALMEGPKKIKYQGTDKDVEIGAVIWVHAYPMK
jgi:cobalt/nickel transport protein